MTVMRHLGVLLPTSALRQAPDMQVFTEADTRRPVQRFRTERIVPAPGQVNR